jgi:hypothetical protein
MHITKRLHRINPPSKEFGGRSARDGRSKNMLSRSAMAFTSRWATVLLTMGAWLLLSNHCALGLTDAAKPDLESAGCPMHSAPGKEKPATNLLCCKDLRAIAPHALKNVAAVASQLVGARDYVTAVVLMPPRLTTQLLALDTGPPYLRTFAESILQRSLLAHAPPASFPRV